jgi:hypothetical protein
LAEPVQGDGGEVSYFNPEGYASSSVKYADALIAELDRTAPKPTVICAVTDENGNPIGPEIVDDGRDLVCTEEYYETATVTRSNSMWAGQVRLRADVALRVADARLYAQRIIKLCDEIEGEK